VLYVDAQGHVQDSALPLDDAAHSLRALPDLLADQPALQHVLQLVLATPTQSGGGELLQHATLRRVPRDAAFGAYYTVRKTAAPDSDESDAAPPPPDE